MPETVKLVYKEVKSLRKDIEEIKRRLDEGYELSQWAKKRIENFEKNHKRIPHSKVTDKLSQ